MKDLKKEDEYAAKIIVKIQELFDEDDENYIDLESLEATDFAHALMNVAPAHIMNKLMNEQKDILESNHMANQLCFQYTKLIKGEE